MTTSDAAIMTHIGDLVHEETELRTRHDHSSLNQQERVRLKAVETELDQYWDLLNQRRALREFDLDPDDASVRDKNTVEGYLQ